MEASAFDSNKYAQRLVEAGVSQENANLQADAVGEVMHAVVSLDTKVEKYHAEDLVEFAAIRAQLSELDARVTKELAEQRVLLAEQRIMIAGQEGNLVRIEGRMTAMEGRITAMEGLITAMDAKIDSMESRFDAKLSALEKRLMRWILIVGSALGVLQTVLGLAPRYLG